MVDAEALRDSTCSPSLLIKQCESALDLGTNKGDQDFHFLVENFCLVMRDALLKEEVDFVAFCLATSYAKAVKSVKHADEITALLNKQAHDLIESNDVLLIAIQGQGTYGKILAKNVLLEYGIGRAVL